MKSDIIKFFSAQRQIFGICPHSGQFFRLSDCRLYTRRRPTRDWMDDLEAEDERIDRYEEKIYEEEEVVREASREKGRRRAARLMRKADPLFRPRRLDPDDAKVIFHPVDYLVFKGMKSAPAISKLVFLDRKPGSREHRTLQKSIEKTVEKGKYEWLTLRVRDDGGVEEE
jgi:predicted Holliday junction resolvase-like endonuclease